MIGSDAKQNGVVYTPEAVVRRILGSVLPASADGLAGVALCDPACGDGAFLSAHAAHVLDRLPRRAALRALGAMAGIDLDREALSACAARLDGVLRSRYPDASVDWDLARRDVLDRRGLRGHLGRFTHVVGNPPYVRVQHLGAGRRERARGQWETLRGATDLYILFYELGLELLRDGGLLGYITPSSWMRSDSGRRLREILASRHRVRKVLDYGEHQVFGEVTAYTQITVVEKAGRPGGASYWRHDGRRFRNAGTVHVPRDAPSAPWVASTRAALARLRELRARGPRLGEVADIRVGVQTLADGVFILEVEPGGDDRHVLCRAGGGIRPLERWMLRPILKASVMRDGADPVDRVVVYPYDGRGRLLPEDRIRSEAPGVWEWLSSQRGRLLARDKGTFDPAIWHAWGRSVAILSGFGEKILTSPMNIRPGFQVCLAPETTFYSGYSVKPRSGIPLDRLARELNSEEMDFFIRQTSRVYQGGWMSYAKSFIREFPLPRALVAG